MELFISILNNQFMLLFLILSLGLLLGKITICGISLGESGVLFVALVFGHFHFTIPDGIGTFGLLLFIYCVGVSAGPSFFKAFASQGVVLAKLSVLTVVLGGIITTCIIKFFEVPLDLGIGLFAGALTSTPALASGIDALKDFGDLVPVGYGIAYPFGVIGVVLFVQLLPRLLNVDLNEIDNSSEENKNDIEPVETVSKEKDKNIEKTDIFKISIALVLGILLGKLPIPLFGGKTIMLGLAGGPLFVALLLSYFKKTGNFPVAARSFLQTFGLILFLANAGVKAGGKLVPVLQEYGFILFLYGGIITILPMLITFFIAYKFLKINILEALGGICGGMTSTPALGAITSKTDSIRPVTSYAVAYPVALILMTLIVQLIVSFFI